jgi:hypothetical protein
LGFLEGEPTEVPDLAVDRVDELDHRTIAADDLAECVTEVLEGLPERGPGFVFR